MVGSEGSLPHSTMTTFLTVKEAAKLTGKSASSVRRVIYPIVRDDGHVDRVHVSPSVDDAQALRMKGENFAWRISEELLKREIPVVSQAERTGAAAHATGGGGQSELLAILREELQIKNQQIAQQTEMLGKQMELINGLSERLREGNILIGSLQQRLALTDGAVSVVSG